MRVINRHTTLFFDASVLVAGAHSARGGSALLLEACRLGGFTAQSSFLVMLEALHTLKRNFPERSQARFTAYLAAIDWELLPVPSERELEKYASLIDAKDLHVLAAAVEGASQFLLTLDRRHILAAAEAVQAAGLPLEILRPGDFIQQYCPLHEKHSSLPPPIGRPLVLAAGISSSRDRAE
jgi:predicted nucleic acid-binding protein